MTATQAFTGTQVTVFVTETEGPDAPLFRYSGEFISSDETGLLIRRNGKLVYFPPNRLVRIEAP